MSPRDLSWGIFYLTSVYFHLVISSVRLISVSIVMLIIITMYILLITLSEVVGSH